MKAVTNKIAGAATLLLLALAACTPELQPRDVAEKDNRFYCGNASMPDESVVTGLYESGDSSCPISLQLLPKEAWSSKFIFTLKTPTRSISGELKMVEKANNEVYYFQLQNLPWSDDGTAANSPNGVDTAIMAANKKAAAAVQFKLDHDRVYIRNRGDVENDFCQLAECPGNYLTLYRRYDTLSYYGRF